MAWKSSKGFTGSVHTPIDEEIYHSCKCAADSEEKNFTLVKEAEKSCQRWLGLFTHVGIQ